MVKLVLFLLLTSIFTVAYSQSYTTVTKSCGNCGKQVSSSAKIGDKCPYCGVVWSKESSSTTNTNSSYQYLYYKADQTNSSSTTKSNNVENQEETDKSNASKKETEEWVLSKLKLYTPKKYYHSFANIGLSSGYQVVNISYDLDNYCLIIKYGTVQSVSLDYIRSHKSLPKIDTTFYKTSIPIYNIDKIYDYQNEIVFKTKTESMIERDLTANKTKTEDYFSVEFETKAETDLCKRIHLAFLHLKKFYKKPPSNEPF